GMRAYDPRQGEEGQRSLEVHRRRIPSFGQARPLRLLAIDGLAELDVRSEAPGAEGDRQPALRVVAQCLPVGADLRGLALGKGKLPRVAALGVVGAADECAVFAQLERQAARPAVGALSRIAAIGTGGEDVWPEEFVEMLQDLRDAEFLGLVHIVGELSPEL